MLKAQHEVNFLKGKKGKSRTSKGSASPRQTSEEQKKEEKQKWANEIGGKNRERRDEKWLPLQHEISLLKRSNNEEKFRNYEGAAHPFPIFLLQNWGEINEKLSRNNGVKN